jgi:hypothetical protein
MEYELHRATAAVESRQPQKRQIVPPRPALHRNLRNYSSNDLNSLTASVNRLKPVGLCSLTSPSFQRVTTWPALESRLKLAKARLRYLWKANGFPSMILVTEFDPIESGSDEVCANFHIGFSAALTTEQVALLKDWWIKVSGAPSNQGRFFDYRSDGGSQKLDDYLSKDLDKREAWREVKFVPSWIPESANLRLWFCVGSEREKARDGARIRRDRRMPRRSRNYRTQRITSRTSVLESEEPETVVSATPDSSVLYPFKDAFKAPENMCQVCWTRWGRSLWDTCCKCTGHIA